MRVPRYIRLRIQLSSLLHSGRNAWLVVYAVFSITSFVLLIPSSSRVYAKDILLPIDTTYALALEGQAGLKAFGFGVGFIDQTNSLMFIIQMTYEAARYGLVGNQEPEPDWYWVRLVDTKEHNSLSFGLTGGTIVHQLLPLELLGGLGLYFHDRNEHYVSTATGWSYYRVHSDTRLWYAAGLRLRIREGGYCVGYLSVITDPIQVLGLSAGFTLPLSRHTRMW